MINDSIRTIAETEEIGGVIMNELQRNSETIKSSHNKVSYHSTMTSFQNPSPHISLHIEIYPYD